MRSSSVDVHQGLNNAKIFVLKSGPATLLADVGGVAICCDPLIQDWLNYNPISKARPATQVISKDPAKEAVVDSKLSEAAIPLAKASGLLYFV